MSERLDAVVVGCGPNGLAAAIALARAGRSVRVLEARETIGGGTRSAELTLPGFRHDICSAVHPFAVGAPFFRSLELERHGLEWLHAEVELAHPLDDGRCALLYRSLGRTVRELGEDGRSYARLVAPFARSWDELAEATLGPITRVPRHPLLLARFGLLAVQSASGLIGRRFEGELARGMVAGIAAHATLPLGAPLTASFALLLGATAHRTGWPVARGGSDAIPRALAAVLRGLGGEIVTSHPVRTLADLPQARAYLFDVTPHQLLAITGDRFHGRYARQLRAFGRGAAVFKVDYALSGPVPWSAERARGAATVHLGGTLEAIAESEDAVARGRVSERPYVIVVQPTVADPSRAPAGGHTLWAYCHVPNGWSEPATERIERQIERAAPGFRDLILARATWSPADLEAHNPNYLGGDIAGGSHGGLQLLARPALRWNPYRTPDPRIFLCSSSTPPGAGVHGMCGYWGAQAAMRRTEG